MPFPSQKQAEDILLQEEMAPRKSGRADRMTNSDKLRNETQQLDVSNIVPFVTRLVHGTIPLAHAKTTGENWRSDLIADEQLRSHVDKSIERGAGVRACQSLIALSKALAWCRSDQTGGHSVCIDDVCHVSPLCANSSFGFQPGKSESMLERENWTKRFVKLMKKLVGSKTQAQTG